MDFNNIINSLIISETNSLSIFDILITFILPFFLSLFIAWFYKKTNSSANYSKEFIYSILLFSSLTAVITLLIGSNIARAFGLVAALSLIRFRTALKSSLDGIYLFWSLAVGMSCGVGFYFAAVLIVITGIILMFIAQYFRVGDVNHQTVLIKARFNANDKNNIVSFQDKLQENVQAIEHLNRLFNTSENWIEHVYSISLNKSTDPFLLKEELIKQEDIINIEIFNSEMAVFN